MSCAAALLFCCSGGLPATAQDEDEPLRRAVQRSVRSAPHDAEAALESVVRRGLASLKAALRAADPRDAVERVRLRQAADVLSAELRAAAWSGGLSEEDRARFDRFAEQYPALVPQVFSVQPQERLDSLLLIPRTPDSGAGLLIAALAQDDELEVIEAALKVAREFPDPILLRALTRFLADGLQILESDLIQEAPEEFALLYGRLMYQTIIALCAGKHMDALPEIERVVRRYAGSAYEAYIDTGEVVDALGQTGDERAAPLLLALLEQGHVRWAYGEGAGVMRTQTLGDAALLALLRIYDRSPETIGFGESERGPGRPGFTNREERAAALTSFRRWHARNATLPAEQRGPLEPIEASSDSP